MCIVNASLFSICYYFDGLIICCLLFRHNERRFSIIGLAASNSQKRYIKKLIFLFVLSSTVLKTFDIWNLEHRKRNKPPSEFIQVPLVLLDNTCISRVKVASKHTCYFVYWRAYEKKKLQQGNDQSTSCVVKEFVAKNGIQRS